MYILTFHTARGFCIHAGHWPFLDYHTFRYPGFPSLFIPYKQANDFYFSGHTGYCVILMMIFIYNFKSKKLVYYSVGLLFFTIYTLTVTRVHYFNDILIGFVAAIFITRVDYQYRFNIHYWTLFCYSKLLGQLFVMKDHVKKSVKAILVLMSRI